MICETCGNNLDTQKAFCSSCGKSNPHFTFANANRDSNSSFGISTNSAQSDETTDPFTPNNNSDDPFDGHTRHSFNEFNNNGFDHSEFIAQQQRQFGRRRLNRALANAIFGIAFSIWTFIYLFADMLGGTWLALGFILADFFSSVPAIVGAVRHRQHSKPKFLAALSMGIVSTLASLAALIYWATL